MNVLAIRRFGMFLRDFREYATGGKARRAAERKRRNRSESAKRGWEKRRANTSGLFARPLTRPLTGWDDDDTRDCA